jgi:hypothetical protein
MLTIHSGKLALLRWLDRHFAKHGYNRAFERHVARLLYDPSGISETGSGTPFGAVIPVTGLNIGFLGQVSRTGERVIAAGQASAQLTPFVADAIAFADAVYLVPDTTAQGATPSAPTQPAPLTSSLGGTYMSLRAAIIGTGTPGSPSGGITFSAPYFSGIAVRLVKTMLGYPQVPGTLAIGSYAPGEVMEVLERGSVVVRVWAGTPQRNQPVYLRTAYNIIYSPGPVGGLEAYVSASSASQVALVGVVFRTGYVDGNGCCEITLLSRQSA